MTATPNDTAPRAALGLTILRIVIGIIFVVHGAQKFFVWGHAGTVGAFTQMHIPLPAIAGVVVPIVEFFGGIALIIGFYARVAAALTLIDMLGAIAFVHAGNGFFNPMGFEYPMTLAAASLVVALAGPGAFALGSVLGVRDHLDQELTQGRI